MFSAYQMTGDGVWVATHRLPLDSAVRACKQFRRHTYNCPVALVPDGVDASPYLKLAERFA